ncbi:junctional adhesion molecule-like [Hyperolius riggenbachi]|uniref:junctional adhesion molecule-like n=1 Tax=Hyperolius riggenbachi TaxID=752182 RepID=UPI0035A27860
MRNFCHLLSILFLLTAASPNTTDESPYLTITGNTTYKAEPGENVTLLCLYGTDNSMELHHLTIRWTKDGSTKWLFNGTSSITAAERDDLYDNKAKLHLSHVQKEDSGTYSCTIHYQGIEKSHVSTLIVEESQNMPEELPFLTIVGKPTYKAKPGENVTLLCMFQTDRSMKLHHLTIRWTKDGSTKWLFNGTSNITPGDLDNLYKNKANLRLSHVQKEDSGTYSCTIHYRRMEKSHVSTLTVEDLNDIFQKPTALTSNTTHDKYRTVKMMLVVGALVTTYCVSFLIFLLVAV